MELLSSFFDSGSPSLKICGIVSAPDANRLADSGVHALGVNFWPQSKRHCRPAAAREFLGELAGRILRVGVFVNNARGIAPGLLEEGLIDVVQLHGDEPLGEVTEWLDASVPLIRAVTLSPEEPVDELVALFRGSETPSALLLDAHAPGVYGGTGKTIDWEAAAEFIERHAPLPVYLAGGITPSNAGEALATTRPAGLDVASGSESAPGIKDFEKVASIQAHFLKP